MSGTSLLNWFHSMRKIRSSVASLLFPFVSLFVISCISFLLSISFPAAIPTHLWALFLSLYPFHPIERNWDRFFNVRTSLSFTDEFPEVFSQVWMVSYFRTIACRIWETTRYILSCSDLERFLCSYEGQKRFRSNLDSQKCECHGDGLR